MRNRNSWWLWALILAYPLSVPGQFYGTSDEIPIWDGPGPGSDTLTIEQSITERSLQGDCTIDRAVENITETGIIPFIAEEPNGSAVVICPGGGYSRVVIDKEGTDVAEWFNSFGISAFVVKYRLPVDDHIHNHLVPLQDAQRALRYVRGNALNWGIDPGKIGIMGFSAGGHMAATLATKYDTAVYAFTDSLDALSARPDFMILIYPVVSMVDGITHGGTRTNLLGPSPSVEQITAFSAEMHVDSRSPITFMARALDDGSVPEENCTALGNALTAAGVENVLYQYSDGGHGRGICQAVGYDFANWVNDCGRWLYDQGLTDSLFIATHAEAAPALMQFSVYPNPAPSLEKLTFILPDADHLLISLYDMSGRKLDEKRLSHVVAGEYTLEFTVRGNQPETVIFEMKTGSVRVSRLLQTGSPGL